MLLYDNKRKLQRGGINAEVPFFSFARGYARHRVLRGKPGKPGDKLRRKVKKGMLTINNPDGVIGATFREITKEKNLKRLKARRAERAGHPVE